jgi:hydroxymethylpyrimidine pyrophosphatase-like HAD family hydrolase
VGFAVRGENGIREQIRQELAAYPGEYRMELFGNGIVADIYAPDANKMTALVHLTERLGIAPENCIAFGDGKNDMEMIRWAGIGIAMGNACPELKAAADAVCGATWEDGIEKHLQKRNLI